MLARHLPAGLALGVALLAAGCATDDDWVVRPPGHGSGTHGGPGSDAGTDGGGGGEVTGRLCVLADLLAPDACSTIDAGGVTVRGGGRTATTDGAGRFSLATTADALVLEVEPTPQLVAATVPVETADSPVTVPVVRIAAFTDAIMSFGVPDLAGQAGIVIYIDDAAGAPLPGVTFTPVAGAAFAPVYDAGSNTTWVIDAGTGAAGVAMMLGVPATARPAPPDLYTVVGLTADDRMVTIRGVPVRPDAVTFVRSAVP